MTAKKETEVVEVPVVDDTQRDETERILPDPEGPLRLHNGVEVLVQPLKLRQFLKLIKIVTEGGAAVLDTVKFTTDMDTAEFAQTFISLVIFAIPQAEDATVEFLRSMVEPADTTGNREKDTEARLVLWRELENPELEDTIDIISAVVQREAGDLKALGNRLRAMVTMAQKTGQLNK